MPYTVNGIGTIYYGRRNAKVRQAYCPQCGKYSTLSSYDTTLWFVIVFIPVIPLGRKRILDDCSVCRRGRIAAAAEHEKASLLSIAAASEQYRNNPTPEAALSLHAQMLSYGMHDEASKFRNAVSDTHADSAIFLAGLADHFDQIGNPGEATPLFEQAYERDPQLPAARIGVAFRRIHTNELDQARELLRFLEAPGAGKVHSLYPLEHLAKSLQAAGRHADALQIYQHLVTEIPSLANNYPFRKLVSTSEKALQQTKAIPQTKVPADFALPSPQRSFWGIFSNKDNSYAPWQRNAAWGSVIAVAIAAICFASNEYTRTHRTVTIVHSAQTPVSVSIDGAPEIPARRMAKLTLSEGTHKAKFSGAITDEVEFTVQTSFFERFTRSPAWVLNPGCTSALCLETIHYAVVPQPNQIAVSIGESSSYFPHVDYLFTAPPDTLRLEKGTTEATKTHLRVLSEPPSSIVAYVAKSGSFEKVIPYVEAQLRLDPDSSEMHMWYLACALSQDQRERATAFLKSRLFQRPISIIWNRNYQNLMQSADGDQSVAAEYDAELQNDPDNAALLYLRGRASSNRAETESFMERAKTADPNLAWPWYSTAYRAVSDGNWNEAKISIDKARELKLPDNDLERIRHTIRLAADDLTAMENEYRNRLLSHTSNPDWNDLSQLCEVLVAAGKNEACMLQMDNWVAGFRVELRSSPQIASFRHMVRFIQGDLETLDRAMKVDPNPDAAFRLHVLATLNRPAEAASDEKLADTLRQADHALALSLAFSLADQPAEADAWREKAAAALGHQDRDSRRISGMLRQATPPTADELREIITQPDRKALLLAVLAQQFPEQKDEFSASARLLNVGRPLTYYLVQKAVEKPGS